MPDECSGGKAAWNAWTQERERDRMDALAAQWRTREAERAAAAEVASAAVSALEGRARKVPTLPFHLLRGRFRPCTSPCLLASAHSAGMRHFAQAWGSAPLKWPPLGSLRPVELAASQSPSWARSCAYHASQLPRCVLRCSHA